MIQTRIQITKIPPEILYRPLVIVICDMPNVPDIHLWNCLYRQGGGKGLERATIGVIIIMESELWSYIRLFKLSTIF